MSDSPLTEQVGGSHYRDLPIQPFELTAARRLDAFAHTILKYVTRYPAKGGVADLKKARHTAELRATLIAQTDQISVGDYVKKNGLGQLEEAILLALDIWVKSERANGVEYRMCIELLDQLISQQTKHATEEDENGRASKP